MLLVDAIFRFGGLAFLCMIAVTSWRHRAIWPSAPYLLLACISVGALFLGYTRPEFAPPEPLLAIVRFIDVPHLPFVWLFSLSVCVPDFRLRHWHIAVVVLYSAPILWPRLHLYELVQPPPDWLPVYGAITSVLLVGHLVQTVALALRGNSVAHPSLQMLAFVSVLMVATVGAALSEIVPDGAQISRQTVKVAAIFPALAFGTAWMLRLKIPALSPGKSGATLEDLSNRERELLDIVEDHLFVREGYRDHRLTMARLAQEIGVSQDRLRSLINQKLGYANFNAYINSIRINSVCQEFGNPSSSSEPILTLAIDAGFKSISVFNKAFKSVTGETPSRYRARLAQEGQLARNQEGFSGNQQDGSTACN